MNAVIPYVPTEDEDFFSGNRIRVVTDDGGQLICCLNTVFRRTERTVGRPERQVFAVQCVVCGTDYWITHKCEVTQA